MVVGSAFGSGSDMIAFPHIVHNSKTAPNDFPAPLVLFFAPPSLAAVPVEDRWDSGPGIKPLMPGHRVASSNHRPTP